jgi:hypothetical protein
VWTDRSRPSSRCRLMNISQALDAIARPALPQGANRRHGAGCHSTPLALARFLHCCAEQVSRSRHGRTHRLRSCYSLTYGATARRLCAWVCQRQRCGSAALERCRRRCQCSGVSVTDRFRSESLVTGSTGLRTSRPCGVCFPVVRLVQLS